MEKPVIRWKAGEYIKYNRGLVWMTGAGLVAAALIAYALLKGEWTMALVFSVLSVVYYLYQKQEPKEIEISMNELGITVARKFYPFSGMRAFWIIYEPPYVKTLHIRFAKKGAPDLVIQLGDQDPVPVRNFLLSQLPEWEGKEEAPMDALIRFLKL